MQELILSRMMRISRGTYYSGSWSSTACIFQISLHPRLGLNPSSPGAGRPTHQPPSLWNNGISGVAWVFGVAWVIYRFHTQTHNKSVKSVQEIEGTKGGIQNPPLFYRRKDQPITLLLQYMCALS